MMKFFRNCKIQIITVLITFILLELIFVFAGIKPFSADRILISDLYYEYIPFYNYFRDAILSGRSILSSFSFTMGQNVIGILAYYCLSPLNILLLFSNSYNIAYFIKALIIIKILLCSLTMSIYLKGKTSDLKVVMFSLIYALTSYNILYAFNVMWLDVVYLLPLVILGLENFINGKGKNLYLISLSIMIFSNFYIAFGSCIFALFYFFYYSFIKEKLTLKLFSKFLGLSLIAGLLNAFMLLPTFYNMLGGKFDNAGTYANFILYDPKAIIYNFIPGVKVGSFLIDLPYFYVSSLVLVLFSLFIFSSSVKIKEKIATFIFILLLVFFTLIAPLDLMMHCFRVPNCFNYRYIFNLSFLFISVVARKELKFTYFAIIPLVLIIAWACTLNINYQVIIFAILLIAYWILFKFNKSKIIFLIIILELVYSGATVRQLKPSDLNYDKVNSYKELLKEYMPSENKFYRIELSKPITVNDSFILGTYGISSFSPTLSSVSNTFLKDYLKMPEKDSYNLVYKNRTIFDPYILGIKYEIKDDQVVENKNYLPLVFKIDNLDYFEPSDSVLENTNKIYYMINGEYILKEVEFEIDCVRETIVTKKECNVDFNKEDGYQYYIELFSPLGINEVMGKEDYSDSYYIKLIEDDFKLEFITEQAYIESIKIYGFKEDEIKNQKSNFITFNDTYLKMNVTSGYYMTTIPYDDSWHIRNNGKEIEKIKVLDSLIAFEASDGEIELEYVPKGINAGILISGLTFMLVLIYYIRKNCL